MTSSCTLSSSSKFFPACLDSGVLWKTHVSISSHNRVQKPISFLCVYVLRWEIVWRNAPHIWRDFGSAVPFQTRLTQTQPVLPLSKEHGSLVKDQGRRQCCHNGHKKFPYRPTHDVSLLSGHASYNITYLNGMRLSPLLFWQGKTKVLKKKKKTQCQLFITSHRLPWDWTWASTVNCKYLPQLCYCQPWRDWQ